MAISDGEELRDAIIASLPGAWQPFATWIFVGLLAAWIIVAFLNSILDFTGRFAAGSRRKVRRPEIPASTAAPRSSERGPLRATLRRVAFVILAVGTSGLLGASVFARISERPPIDGDGCVIGLPPPASTAVLVDLSDPLTGTDAARVAYWVEEIIEGSGEHEWLSLSLLDAYAGDAIERAYGACAPKPAREANPLFENPEFRRREFDHRVREVLVEAADETTRRAPQDSSPIAEGIYSVARDPRFSGSSGVKRLIIISDLMQNSEIYSFYRPQSDLTAFEAATSAYRRNLQGVEVVLVQIGRPRASTPAPEFVALWREYLEQQGATVVVAD